MNSNNKHMASNICSPQVAQRQSWNGVYSIISPEKEKENDRERILKKFCLHTNTPHHEATASKSHKKTLSETRLRQCDGKSPKSPPHIQLSIFIDSNKVNTRNKSAHNRIESKSLSVNIKKGTGTTKDITRKTNQSSHMNSHYSEDTEKESKSHLMLASNKLSYDFKANNCIYDKLSNESFIEIDHTEGKRMTKNSYLPLSNENSSISSENCRSNASKHIKNCDNDNYIHQYNQDNIMFVGYSSSQSKHRKMQQLFSSNPSYNISNRFINDEVNTKHHIDFNKEFKFIREVKEDNDQLRKIKLVSFLEMSDYSIYTLLSFAYESFDALVLNRNKLISTKINLCMNNIFERIVKVFKEKYSDIIQLEEFYFKQKTFKRTRSLYPILDLVFKAKVITNEINKSYEIGYRYVNEGSEYDQKWRFEVKEKGKENMMWLASEVELYNKTINRFCYSQSVGSFIKGDIIEFRMNIFSRQLELNPFSIKWKEVVIEPSSKGFYQKSLLKCPYAFNALYACEIENMVHIWKSGQSLENKSLIEDFKKYFEKHFIIKDVVYDYSRLFFYKFRMKANKEGKVKRNHFVNFDIDIIDSKSKPIKNEIQALGLLNSSLMSESIQIRKGTMVVFYITDLVYD